MRLVFAGTPAAALPSLEALLASRHEVAAVLTRPDARSGRGLAAGPSPVAARAAEAGVEVLRPGRPRDPEFVARLREIAPDCCPVTAYGALIPEHVLQIPPHGWVNLHFSLLPAWRGAAPVQHALLHGDDVTGATTFRLVREMDAGPAFGVVTETVQPGDTAGSLLQRLSVAGAGLLVTTLDMIESGDLEARPQPSAGVSLAPKITPADAQVSWKLAAPAVDRLIRACTPAPGAWTSLENTRIKLGPVALLPAPSGAAPFDFAPSGAAPSGFAPSGATAAGAAALASAAAAPAIAMLAPGELLIFRDQVLVGTGTQPVRLGEVQADGKQRMAAADWARGLRLSGRQAVLG